MYSQSITEYWTTILFRNWKLLNVGPPHSLTQTYPPPLQAWNVAWVRWGRVKRKMAASLLKSSTNKQTNVPEWTWKSSRIPSPVRSVHVRLWSIGKLRDTPAMPEEPLTTRRLGALSGFPQCTSQSMHYQSLAITLITYNSLTGADLSDKPDLSFSPAIHVSPVYCNGDQALKQHFFRIASCWLYNRIICWLTLKQ